MLIVNQIKQQHMIFQKIFIFLVQLQFRHIYKITQSIQNMSINLRKLTSISVQLAQQASSIVHDSYFNKKLKKYMKTQHDPVTQADFKIQTLIVNGLKEFYPQLKIVGEEQVSYEGIIDFNYKNMKEEYLPQNFNLDRQCSAEDLCVWIDPIDCTKGFVENHVQDVTVLIGISEKKKASIGVVGIPFKMESSNLSYKPSVVVGAVQAKSAFEFYFHSESESQNEQGKWFQLNPNFQPNECRIAISSNRKPTEENKVIEDLKGEKWLAGGSGRKIMMVAKNEVEMMLYMKSFTNKWDSCAGEAVIKAMGGYFKSAFGDELEYDWEKEKEANWDGFFCTFSKQLSEEVVNLCNKKYKKKSDSVV